MEKNTLVNSLLFGTMCTGFIAIGMEIGSRTNEQPSDNIKIFIYHYVRPIINDSISSISLLLRNPLETTALIGLTWFLIKMMD